MADCPKTHPIFGKSTILKSGFSLLFDFQGSIIMRKNCKIRRKTGLILLLFLVAFPITKSQTSFFKFVENPQDYFNQRIVRLPNGGMVIGDSSLKSLQNGLNGKIFATKIDPCGNVEWSYAYERPSQYLELKDITVNDQGEIFLFGSAYEGLDERVFLLKLKPSGASIAFNQINTGTVDHFSYSMDWQAGQIMIYGLLLDWNIQKQGFLAVFDERLNYKWGKRFTPFESFGEGVITKDNGFLGRSGPYIYRFSESGELDWALRLENEPVISPVAGPVEVNGGFIFEAFENNQAFIFKLGYSGELLWKSDLFPSSPYGAAIQTVYDGSILVFYNAPGDAGNFLSQLKLNASGDVLFQKRMVTDEVLNTGNLYAKSDSRNFVTLTGNAALPAGSSLVGTDFLIQFPINEESNECFAWETVNHLLPNNVRPNLVYFDTLVMNANIRSEYNGTIKSYPVEAPFYNACLAEDKIKVIVVDSILPCGIDWLVTLPSAEFSWEDIGAEKKRVLVEPGVYRAKNQNCDALTVYEYRLEKSACNCVAYLPNAFSPNEDGQNDLLLPFGNCTFLHVETQVFDRWGNLVFEGNNPEKIWDGTIKGEKAPSGVYIVKMVFEASDETGSMQFGSHIQDVLLIR